MPGKHRDGGNVSLNKTSCKRSPLTADCVVDTVAERSFKHSLDEEFTSSALRYTF